MCGFRNPGGRRIITILLLPSNLILPWLAIITLLDGGRGLLSFSLGYTEVRSTGTYQHTKMPRESVDGQTIPQNEHPILRLLTELVNSQEAFLIGNYLHACLEIGL